jgi:hypothetical protein
VRIEYFNKKLNTTNPNPIAAITPNKITPNFISNHTPKLTSVNSRKISQRPLVSKNFRVLLILSFFFMDIKAETPERNTKVGAHKCVIQRVKNKTGVVVFRSVGDCVRELVCIKSLT